MMKALSKCILKVVKTFYNIPEAHNYLFAIYYKYYINSFIMTESTYDPCLLFRYERFSIIDLQTDNTLMLANNTFTSIEEKTIKTARFMTKKQACFLLKILIKFNDT